MNKFRVKILDNGKVDCVYSSPTPASGYSDWIKTDIQPNLSDYWDGNAFVSIGEPPSPHHTFDYVFKEWIDPRSLDEIKEQKWQKIKKQREILEFGSFVFEGNMYDSDQVSQGRIMGAALAGVEQVWTLADNTTVKLTAVQLQQLYAAMQAHVASVHEKGRIARTLIEAATTKEEVEAVQL